MEDSYIDSSWYHLDFRMKESIYAISSSEDYTVLSDHHATSARGYSVPVFLAKLDEADLEGVRINACHWLDASLTTGSMRSSP